MAEIEQSAAGLVAVDAFELEVLLTWARELRFGIRGGLMKTLVVGDLHLKQQFVLPRIDGCWLVMRKLGVSYFGRRVR